MTEPNKTPASEPDPCREAFEAECRKSQRITNLRRLPPAHMELPNDYECSEARYQWGFWQAAWNADKTRLERAIDHITDMLIEEYERADRIVLNAQSGIDRRIGQRQRAPLLRLLKALQSNANGLGYEFPSSLKQHRGETVDASNPGEATVEGPLRALSILLEKEPCDTPKEPK